MSSFVSSPSFSSAVEATNEGIITAPATCAAATTTSTTTTSTTTANETAVVPAAVAEKTVVYFVNQAPKVKPIEQDENDVYEPKLKDKSRMAVGRWDPALGLVHVVQMRGNFWKVHGFTWNKKDYLYPEEALLLIERSLLMIEYEGVQLKLKQFYEIVLTLMPMECYMTYAKLRSLEYIVFRHPSTSSSSSFAYESDKAGLRNDLYVITDDDDLHKLQKQDPVGFFSNVISFDIYLHTSGWSKKMLLETNPVHHVIVHNGEFMPNSSWLFQLLKHSGKIPLLFSIITSTLSIILEEVADAELYLKFVNEVAIPLKRGVESDGKLSVFNLDEFMFAYHASKAANSSNENGNSKGKKRKFEKKKKGNRDSNRNSSSSSNSNSNGNSNENSADGNDRKVAKIVSENEA